MKSPLSGSAFILLSLFKNFNLLYAFLTLSLRPHHSLAALPLEEDAGLSAVLVALGSLLFFSSFS